MLWRRLESGAGDHVAILIKNDMRFVESFFGPLRLGAIVTAVTTRAHYNTFSHIVRDCGAKVLIASRDFATEAARLDDEIAALEHVLVMDTPPDAVRDYDAWRDAAPTDQVDTPVDDDDIALLSYTAGVHRPSQGRAADPWRLHLDHAHDPESVFCSAPKTAVFWPHPCSTPRPCFSASPQ